MMSSLDCLVSSTGFVHGESSNTHTLIQVIGEHAPVSFLFILT